MNSGIQNVPSTATSNWFALIVPWSATGQGPSTVPLVGAIRRSDNITLSTALRECSPPTVPAQVVLEHTTAGWSMSGTWFETAVGGTEIPELKIAPGSTGSSVDGATVTLALSGTGKIGDYPVGLAGSIEAIDCRIP